MQKITQFLWFDKNCEEAMNFYVDVFNNSPQAGEGDSKVISIKRYPEGPLEPPLEGMEGKVWTGVFQLKGQTFMALDGGPIFKPTAATSLYINCKDQEEVDYFWEKLKEGGDPKNQQCGWLSDKYGFWWQIIPQALPKLLEDPDKAKADKVLKCMLEQKKIVVEELEKAANS